MKLEQQVCSVDIAKRLKELGMKQEGLFRWVHDNVDRSKWYITESLSFQEGYTAFTVAELGEMLPDRTLNQDDDKGLYPYNFVTWPYPDPMHKWKAYINKANGRTMHTSLVTAPTEANARAKMLIYLLENKLISPH